MSQSALFDSPAPRVFTLPAGAPFLTALAEGLHAAFPDPEILAGVTVLAPTRRAGRALAEAFAALKDGPGAALLPMIRPIGDVDADDPPFEPGELAEAAPDAISPLQRQFELARLIGARETAAGRSMSAGGALSLAGDLARLIDDLATQEVEDLSALTDDIRAALPAHRQEAALFLDIILTAWPARLAELGLTDPARRRSLLLRALARRWREHPPEGPVIAAGSTGSIPAAADLLSVVAGLPKGAVVLPGLDTGMDEAAWAAVDDTHPQRAMKALLARMELDHRAIPAWPWARPGAAAAARARVIAEALRPAEATGDWLNQVDAIRAGRGEDAFAQALAGLSLIEAPAPAEEARAVALALRETLETPGRRAVLVTPDRALARRVIVEMARFGVELDDSAGAPLSDTPPGAFLMRILDAARDPGSALALIALYASPLLALGEARAALSLDLMALERWCLRGRRPGRSTAQLRAHVETGDLPDWMEPRRARFLDLIDVTLTALAPLTELSGEQPCAAWAQALARAAETLARDAERAGAERVWAGDAGEAAAGLVRGFLHESEALDALTLDDFAGALLETARARMVRPRAGGHPRLQVLGPLEARLISADRVILAGLNEGVWPAGAKIDPFLSPGMRARAGLGAPEQRFGLAAHDFAQLACLPEVILTRSTKVDGAPTVASRWLWRLQTLARGALGADADAALHPDTDYLALARALDHPAQRTSVRAPAPRPAVEHRPRALPVTAIETWVRDPYAIFARHILKLRTLDAPDQPAGPAERGSAYHRAFERWVKGLGTASELPRDAHDRLVSEGRAALLEAGMPEDLLGLELARFERAARFVVSWEEERRRAGFLPEIIEKKGKLTLHDAPGGPFEITARADRIDMRPDGALDIIDYKTGRAPSANEAYAFFAPQLALTALIAAEGGFEDCPRHEPGDLIYLKAGGGKTPGEAASIITSPGSDEAADKMHEAREDLIDWITRFDDPDTEYLSQPRRKWTNTYGDYDHLARRKEWASAPGEGGGED
ncbi:double-strand break repair protein AddB [Alkalicaulis satelles]|uniref:Double-strand break repair protein AddB n=1 Tax=Alkalicaulis satelles TaxID=2609175 RepID=A0A5M6ZFY9_9PROT|nr:double-strand break repair protein AddB [Alkalicaulis satelles]KAA5803666.1 double-strand break repair protein AddB [Alkalicaulis satelles]